ncbi:MAG: metallophosphoesterase [Deltaproteobacteria bacterium]|nr:metallophosphoesterase [Deltaproteobacteria bacterium]
MGLRLIATVIFLGVLSAAQVSGAGERNTVVFISDLHMNVDANYSWLKDHAADLSQFLTDVNAREDVAELVILGDLVDDWVSPVEDAPQSFAEVLNADTNADIVAALKAICDNTDIAVTYVTGNHDMLSFQTENKGALADALPGMAVISESPGLGAYKRDSVIWAEHGHRYCLFNAPDTWSREGGHLPMGYFISRMAATKAASTGQVTTMHELLDTFVKAPADTLESGGQKFGAREESGEIFDDAAIIAVFNAIALWSGLWPWDGFTMNGMDGYTYDPIVEEIAVVYDGIYSGWPLRQDRVSQVEAVWNDLGALNSAANLIFEMPDYLKDKYPFIPRIILFGHTHEAAFQYHSGSVDTIYVNTGTWIDGKDMTWAEIRVTDREDGKSDYEVSLWFYGETSPRQTGALTATPARPTEPDPGTTSWADMVTENLLSR